MIWRALISTIIVTVQLRNVALVNPNIDCGPDLYILICYRHITCSASQSTKISTVLTATSSATLSQWPWPCPCWCWLKCSMPWTGKIHDCEWHLLSARDKSHPPNTLSNKKPSLPVLYRMYFVSTCDLIAMAFHIRRISRSAWLKRAVSRALTVPSSCIPNQWLWPSRCLCWLKCWTRWIGE